MVALLALVYTIHVVSPQQGTHVDLKPLPGPWISQGHYWGPAGNGLSQLPNVALSRSGEVAIIVYTLSTTQIPYALPAKKLIVIRPDDSRVVLSVPPDAELAKSFRQYALIAGERAYPSAHFEGVRFARDGTPFATVVSWFSGAYSGADKGVFAWNGQQWTNVLPPDTPYDWSNISLGAADTPWRGAYDVDYSNSFPNLDEEQTPHYQENWTFVDDGAKRVRIGYGATMSMSGDAVVGYSAGLGLVAKSQLQACSAWEWRAGKFMRLGPGMANGVNASGVAVGDDEPVIGADAHPILWRDGKTIRLSQSLGTALAIADDGTIVGRIGSNGFMIRGGDPSRTVIRIDTLLADRSWHISSVLAISANGRLLAIGSQANSGMQLILLQPG